jgi:hypothetical protein
MEFNDTVYILDYDNNISGTAIKEMKYISACVCEEWGCPSVSHTLAYASSPSIVTEWYDEVYDSRKAAQLELCKQALEGMAISIKKFNRNVPQLDELTKEEQEELENTYQKVFNELLDGFEGKDEILV